MCHPLIVGSVESLPVSQYAPQWADERDGLIYVTPMGKAKSRDAQAIFSSRYLYYISTRRTGDACGFSGDYKDAQDAREELAVFLDRSLELVVELHLYVACTDFGDSGAMPAQCDDIGPCDIRTWMPGFIAGSFFHVIRDE